MWTPLRPPLAAWANSSTRRTARWKSPAAPEGGVFAQHVRQCGLRTSTSTAPLASSSLIQQDINGDDFVLAAGEGAERTVEKRVLEMGMGSGDVMLVERGLHLAKTSFQRAPPAWLPDKL